MVRSSTVNKYIIGMVESVDADNFTLNPVNLKDHFPDLDTFDLKRFYYVDNIKGDKNTGQHAHNDEDGIFIILQGDAVMILDDDGKHKEEVKVRSGNFVWIPRYVWHGFKQMSDDFIVLILSNKNCNVKRIGYIEDYSEFKNLAKK